MFHANPLHDLALPPRRQFLQQAGLGFGSLALASMLHQETNAAPTPNADPLALRSPHVPAKIKSINW